MICANQPVFDGHTCRAAHFVVFCTVGVHQPPMVHLAALAWKRWLLLGNEFFQPAFMQDFVKGESSESVVEILACRTHEFPTVNTVVHGPDVVSLFGTWRTRVSFQLVRSLQLLVLYRTLRVPGSHFSGEQLL